MGKGFMAALLVDSSESLEEQNTIARLMALGSLNLEKVGTTSVVLEYIAPKTDQDDIMFKLVKYWESPNEDTENGEEDGDG